MKIDIRGRGGKILRNKWAHGPCNYLEFVTSDFPNLFIIAGPGSPSIFANAALVIEQHVDWIADCLVYLRTNHHKTIESKEEAENEWSNHVNTVANFTLISKVDTWFNGANIEGKPKVFMAYAGGVLTYRKKYQEVVANDYQDFILV